MADLSSAKDEFHSRGKYVSQTLHQLADTFQKLLERVQSREQEIAYHHSGWNERAIQKAIAADNLPGTAMARYELGESCEHGLGTDADPVAAFQWYEKSATLRLPQAMCAMGRCYEQGIGVAADAGQAAEWYRKAAEAGHAQAQHEWARCLDAGNGIDVDATHALEWHQRAAECGVAISQYILACHLQPADPEAAHRWYLAAAEQGYGPAALKLAAYYAAHSLDDLHHGLPLDDSYNVNLAWYCCIRGFFPEKGDVKIGLAVSLDLPEDSVWSETPELFRNAVAGTPSDGASLDTVSDLTPQERGLIEAVLRYHDGYCHMKRRDDPTQTVACYKNAVRMGLQYGLVALGECYERGYGNVPIDRDKAREYYTQAAALGSSTAASRLKYLNWRS